MIFINILGWVSLGLLSISAIIVFHDWLFYPKHHRQQTNERLNAIEKRIGIIITE